LRLHGSKAHHAVAFQRGGGVVVVVPRLVLGLAGDWAETDVTLPEGEWQNEFTCETVAGGACRLARLLNLFPVALLTRKESV
jgi:(1->4)-alpha-D-glucan 1-alpha-D-glucosylmutase